MKSKARETSCVNIVIERQKVSIINQADGTMAILSGSRHD